MPAIESALAQEARIELLARSCRRLGIMFDLAAAKARNVWYQEIQLLAAKLGGSSGTLLLAKRALAAVLRSGQSPWRRSVRALWIALGALLPLPLANKLIELRFLPARRPRSTESIVRSFERRRPRRPVIALGQTATEAAWR